MEALPGLRRVQMWFERLGSVIVFQERNETNKPISADVGRARSYLTRLSQTVAALDTDAFDRAIGLVRSAWQNDKQIIVFGNGGSALTAQHYVTDWNKAIYLKTGRPFRGVCLAENMGLITAYANDISYHDVFLEQLKPVLSKGDLVIGISGGGILKMFCGQSVTRTTMVELRLGFAAMTAASSSR